jgi:hypothetical protein
MGGLARIGAGLALAMALGRVVAGCGPSSFACESDESCAGLPEGMCEANGHCSVPDEECVSGRRYAPHSGELSNRCVGEVETGTGSTQGSEGTLGDGEPTSAADTTPTPDGDGSTSMSEPDTTSGDPTVVEPPVMPCERQTIVDEPFDTLPLDPQAWQIFNNPGIAVNVIDGELRLVASEATLTYSSIGTAFGLPSAGSVVVELLAVPDPNLLAEAYLVLTELDVSYGFRVSEGKLELFYEEAFESLPVATLDHDPIEHRWLRLSFEQDSDFLAWESSPDAVGWQYLADIELDTGFDVPDATIHIGASALGNEEITADPLAVFGHAFVCER